MIPCNTDFDCRDEEQCLSGGCTFVGPQPPPSPPEPQGTTDAQCGTGRLCIEETCVFGNCRGDWQSRTDEACINNSCASRCAEDETWVPNPIGSPPIPLGRCQKTAELISCCYETGSPFQRRRRGDEACPVNQACSPVGACYRICGSGPCPGELPRLPDQLPPPERWLDLSKPPPRPPRGETPILWRDAERARVPRPIGQQRN